MKNKITYQWGDEHLLIDLGNRSQPRIRILFWAEFILTSGMATIFLLRSFPLTSDIVNLISGLGAATLYILAAYRFLTRMFSKECILLDPGAFTIITSTPFTKAVATYQWDDIGPLHYTGKSSKTDHPLKGNCYDYFGFETQEQLIQNLHHDGNMYFNHKGAPVRFARCVYSWHAEEMVQMMKIYSGPRLRLGPEWKRMMQQAEPDDVY